ncbi:tripartite tricarboxylate transporter substrate binding protein [Alcaligenaceae bacterium]|nr:tripartite tricarboxylate transporter substrate binding protein [Alcaligenaceae bacterium]
MAIMAIAALGVIGVSGPASADTFPNKPIRIVVPYAPGGFTDIVARLVGQKVSQQLGQPVIVENKAGASTMIGAKVVADSAPDGYTLLMAVTTTISTNPFLFKNLPYKPSDFAPVALAGLTPFVLAAHPTVKADTLAELIALGKSQPDTLNLATLGPGSSTHLVGELFNSLSGLKLNMVPYRGANLALTDLMAGHVQLYFDGIATAAPLFRSGKLKGIAITGDTRSEAAPDVPTFTELNMPGMQPVGSWYGLLAPAGTPQEVIKLLNQATNDALRDPEVSARIAQDGATAPTLSPAEFGELITAHTRTWKAIIEPLNINLDGR